MQRQYDEIANDIESSSPRELIQKLLDRAVQQVSMSKHYMQENQIANKGIAISKAMNIVAYLQSILNTQSDESAELSGHLSDLYAYVDRTLLEANMRNDEKLLDDVIEKLSLIRDAWREMKVE